MEELFKQARENCLWFHSSYQNLWFSPDELQAHRANGRFRWGAENWKLRNPDERLKELADNIRKAKDEHEVFLSRVYASRVTTES